VKDKNKKKVRIEKI